MRHRGFTILVLRHAGTRFRQIRLSYPFTAALVLGALIVGAAGLWAPKLLLELRTQELATDRLEQEYTRLREERDAFEEALAAVAERIGNFEAQASRMAQELGIDKPPVVQQAAVATPAGRPAAGGPAQGGERPPFWFDGDLRGLSNRTSTLDESFAQLGDAFRERMDQLAATPSGMPAEGWFSHGFGWRKDPFTGEREFHRGVDIVAPIGTAVHAPADGVVARAGRFGELGRSIDIAHGYGYVTRYAHLNEVLVRPGDRVECHALIGRVGTTGRSTGPHLHYEVFRDGRHVNPWNYLGETDER